MCVHARSAASEGAVIDRQKSAEGKAALLPLPLTFRPSESASRPLRHPTSRSFVLAPLFPWHRSGLELVSELEPRVVFSALHHTRKAEVIRQLHRVLHVLQAACGAIFKTARLADAAACCD